jgi:acetylornithine deacetylase
VECRLLPGEDGQQTLKDCEQFLRERLAGSVPLDFEDPYLTDPPLETPRDAEVVTGLARSQQESLGFEREVAGANYGTDGSKLSRAGIQNIAQAHTANEFVEIEQVELATRMYGHMLANWEGISRAKAQRHKVST